MIVQAAKTNGTSTASERPSTAKSTTSAIGSAIASPRSRSCESTGSRSCWIAGWPVTYARGSPRERAPHGRRVALRVLEVERRVDLAVEETAVGAQPRRVRAGHELRGGVEAPLRCGEVGAVRAEDDGEDPVGPLAEVVLQDLARGVGLRAGDGERVREMLGQRDRGEDADDEHGEPGEQDRRTEAEDGSCPALGHGVTVTRRPVP